MKVLFLAPSLPTPVDRLADGLRRGGHDVTIGLTEQRPSGAAAVGGVTATAVEEVLPGGYDLAVATTWDATIRLFEADARRYASWVDAFGFERLGTWQAERIGAVLAYDLPVAFIATSPYVKARLEERRPDARVVLARAGLDHEHCEMADRAGGEGPLRVLLGGGEDDVAALEQATAPVARAEGLADADVLVHLDAVDGLPRTLEAARAGVVPVVLPGPQEDVVEHLRSGIVATPEDRRGAGRWLDRLAGDRELLGHLASAARERATSWPGFDEATDELEGALATILDADPPPATSWPTRLMADAMAGIATYRNDYFYVVGELEHLKKDPAVQRALELRDRSNRVKSRLRRG
ncbi:MAG: glycosyltransferase [Solirubrobacterales bacterium]|nr:glycosyltransferase [Solirubrobacterales bacterium]